MAEYKIDIEKSAQNILNKIYERFGVSAERLVELAQADQAGRCVVLPCKPGETVYQITVSVCKWRDVDKCHAYCDGYGDCWEGERIVSPVPFEVRIFDCIGKTVFLTPEAAEAMLAKEACKG